MRHLAYLFPVTFMANRERLTPVLACRLMEISFTCRVSQLSSLAFGSFGMAMAAVGNF